MTFRMVLISDTIQHVMIFMTFWVVIQARTIRKSHSAWIILHGPILC